jgi:hypothetical protein
MAFRSDPPATKEARLVPASAPRAPIPGQLTIYDVFRLLSEPELSEGGSSDEQQPPAPRPRPCRCEHAIGIADEWFGATWIRCLLCGRTVATESRP